MASTTVKSIKDNVCALKELMLDVNINTGVFKNKTKIGREYRGLNLKHGKIPLIVINPGLMSEIIR